MKKHIFRFFLIAAAVIATLTCTAFAAGGKMGNVIVNDDGSYQDEVLVVPEVETIRREGFPVNENGETYGPDALDDEYPDLMLAQNSDGLVGYIREADAPEPRTPEDALDYNGMPPLVFDMYLQDGTTVIGQFRCQG